MIFSKMKFMVSVLFILQAVIVSTSSFAAEPLIFSVHPYLPSAELVKRFTPFVDYLSRETGQQIVLQVASSYDNHIEQIGSGTVDFAYMGPASYVHMVNRFGKRRLLARLETNGNPTFRGVIIVKTDARIYDINELVGKKFAFGDPKSTMSSKVPLYMLMKEGIKLENLAAYVNLKNHNNVALSVLVGDNDAGAVKEEVLNKYKKRGLRVLAWTPEISEHVFVADNKLSTETIDAIQKAMFEIKDTKQGRDILTAIKSSVTALVAVKDQDYENLRTILNTLSENKVKQ